VGFMMRIHGGISMKTILFILVLIFSVSCASEGYTHRKPADLVEIPKQETKKDKEEMSYYHHFTDYR
jgi:hypothetical protein